MNPLHAFLVAAAIAVLGKTLAWFWQLRTRNAGLVDVVWSWTLALLAGFYAFAGTAPPTVRWMLLAMGGLWGLRLGTYLFFRNYNKPEDWRYAQFRERWGARANFNMFWFFQFQNVFTLLLSSSAFLVVAYRPDQPPMLALVIALVLWFTAVLGESLADGHLRRFRARPTNKGKVCRDGLWRYSRHPNYFFECVHWTAYVALAWGAPWGWATLAAPLIMSWMLMKLSGVPMLEESMIKNKPGYAEYVRTTSALIPWWPKN